MRPLASAKTIQDTITRLHVQARQIGAGTVAARAHKRCLSIPEKERRSDEERRRFANFILSHFPVGEKVLSHFPLRRAFVRVGPGPLCVFWVLGVLCGPKSAKFNLTSGDQLKRCSFQEFRAV